MLDEKKIEAKKNGHIELFGSRYQCQIIQDNVAQIFGFPMDYVQYWLSILYITLYSVHLAIHLLDSF